MRKGASENFMIKKEKSDCMSKTSRRKLIISSVVSGVVSGIFFICMYLIVQYQWLFFTFAMIFATFSVISFTFPIVPFLLDKWISLFETLASQVVSKNWRNLNIVIDVLQVIAIAVTSSLPAVGVLCNLNLLQYALLFICIPLPIIAFSRKAAIEIKYVSMITHLIMRFPFQKIHNRILSNYCLRRFAYAFQEIVSIRSLWLLLVLYISGLTFFSPFFRSATRYAILFFSMSMVIALLGWVYFRGNGKERKRTRQVVAKVTAFLVLMICSVQNVFETKNAFIAAYFAAVLSVYSFADSTINKLIEDRHIYVEWRKSKEDVEVKYKKMINPTDNAREYESINTNT